MTAKFQKLKEELRSLESEELYSKPVIHKRKNNSLFKLGLSSPRWFKMSLFAVFMAAFLGFVGLSYFNSDTTQATEQDNPVSAFQNWINQPDEELLSGMGTWMEEMGYTGLSREELIELREQGVTATFTSKMRDLGYKDLPLDQLVRLRQNDVSATFAAMMNELGYNLSVDGLVELRQHDVTAYFTSNMHDLGYIELTKDQLIRLKDVGVSTDDVEELVEERGQRPDINELIRYQISNQ